MHKVSIPDDIVARARLQRGGREHLFEALRGRAQGVAVGPDGLAAIG